MKADNDFVDDAISQSDTALSTEVNLYLALLNEGYDVDFASVWQQPHTKAERVNDNVVNFIEWVNCICK